MDLVDRNLRQRFIPFALKDGGITDTEAAKLGENTHPQFWSFRSEFDGENGKYIGIVPNDHGFFCSDIGVRLQGNKEFDSASKSLDSFLRQIPTIQIREYTQDTRLDLVLSIVEYFKKGFVAGGKVAKSIQDAAKEKGVSVSDMASALAELLAYDIRHLKTSNSWNKTIEDYSKAITSEIPTNSYNDEKTNSKKWVIDFVYMMYYRMLTTTTTNIYTLPYNSSHIAKGNGFDGFETDMFGFGIDKLDNPLLNFVAPNVRVTSTPIWKGIKGGEGINIDLTVNLFNDTVEKSVINYIFVNTIIAQNTPTQFGILQQPPSLYDIRIEGGNRLFMCAGNFECTYKGVLRNVGKKFGEELKKYENKNVMAQFKIDLMYLENDIKIPDIYELNLHFKSLLPNTFNNFIFQFALNSKMHSSIGCTQKGFVEVGTMTDQIDKWITTRLGHAREMIDANKKAEGKKQKAYSDAEENNRTWTPYGWEQMKADRKKADEEYRKKIENNKSEAKEKDHVKKQKNNKSEAKEKDHVKK